MVKGLPLLLVSGAALAVASGQQAKADGWDDTGFTPGEYAVHQMMNEPSVRDIMGRDRVAPSYGLSLLGSRDGFSADLAMFSRPYDSYKPNVVSFAGVGFDDQGFYRSVSGFKGRTDQYGKFSFEANDDGSEFSTGAVIAGLAAATIGGVLAANSDDDATPVQEDNSGGTF